MAKITFTGIEVNTNGSLPSVGTLAPDFKGVTGDLSELALSSLLGTRVLLNIFPSLDTSVCALSVRHFNQAAAKMNNTRVLALSKDLPFAQGRFCTTEGIKNVTPLSQFRCTCFETAYGLMMIDGPLRGLLARAVIVIDEKGTIVYTELVPEITQEPNYDTALAYLK
ncbi:MAG: thiol peroxidase [Bacteroidaceae bacterium]